MPISPATLFGLSQVRHGRGLVSLVQICLAGLFHATTTYAVPLFHAPLLHLQEEEAKPKPASDPSLYAYLGTAIALVLLGGAFAGLTIALMGQDEVYLQVIETSGEGNEKKNAAKVLRLLKKGKHWVLVTLLVGNVITNETLPLVLDRSLGGGYAAAISSTVLVIIFGEIVPQSLCVRFGLPIGAVMSPFVLVLMWIFAPITWPIAKLLDWLLGEDHGTTYKKAGLKTLVDLHKTMGSTPGDRLNEDEVAIISGVLDLKAKAVGSIMTPMDDVFTLSADAVLDEDMIEDIMREGYSRIPIHDPNNEGDFVGMLLVKMLITYDPEDARRVNEFALATLPETRPDTSCLDIINFFQEGKSHMVLVSDFPGQSYGALGVVTLEDVIEELIGEEIIDESDVFVDIHKALRRAAPAPTHRHARAPKGKVVPDNNSQAVGDERELTHQRNGENGEVEHKVNAAKRGSTASIDRKTTFLMRRSSNQSADGNSEVRQVQLNSKDAELKQSLRSLGPSNMASRPRQTRINTVISKPGVSTIPENKDAAKQLQMSSSPSQGGNGERPITTPDPTVAQKGIGEDLLIAPGNDASDGIQALHTEYGTLDRDSAANGAGQSRSESHSAQTSTHGGLIQYSSESRPNKMVLQRSGSHSTLGSLHSQSSDELPRPRRTTARSGSITENIIESGGRKKMVLEPSSSSEDENGASLQPKSSSNRSRGPSHQGRSKDHAHANGPSQDSEHGQDGSKDDTNGKAKAKKRRGHRHRKKKDVSKGDENTPLLSRD